MSKTRLQKREVEEFKRKARDIIQVIAEPVMKKDTPPTDEARYYGVLESWNSISHFPISRRYLYMEVARFFDFETHETIWRIVEAYKIITTGSPDKKSLAGYYRTWQIILNKDSHAA